MSLSENRVVFGAAKQTVKGTPVAATNFPRWGDGTFLEPALTTEKVREGDSTASINYLLKNTQYWKGVLVPQHLRTIDLGFWLKAVLGTASDAVTGSGPYTHTFTPKLVRDYYTLQKQYLLGTPKFLQVSDAVVHSMAIMAERGKPIHYQFDAVGIVGQDLTTAITPAYDASSAPLLYYGGTFNVDGSAVGQVAPFVTSCKIDYKFPVDETMQTEGLTLADFVSTQREIQIDYEILWQDFTMFEKTYFNASVGPDNAAIGSGGINLTFLAGGVSAIDKLQIIIPTMHYSSAPLPQPKLGGKAFLQKCTATAVVSPDLSMILTNSQATVY